MHAHRITTAGALALLLGCQLFVAALPVFDYMWTRINTERYFAAIKNCNDNEKDCLWPGFSTRLIGSHEQLVPAVRASAGVYPSETQVLPAATATAATDTLATPSPCTQQVPQTTTTSVPDLWLELQRRDVALEDIPKSLKSLESTYHSTQTPGAAVIEPCAGGIGPQCKPGYIMLDRGLCMCMHASSSNTKI
ncbi:hypothetical protein PV04_07240 [Phialophora macrospora]|uniref:Long chronological lifespan protein 2 n=1 Tax=Phialophora macrospora TaxID=1851006 RepID=A0A0D2FDM8_9EURO|nr:hypothetical protein PV04_07240 [Phialophora macrospora]